MITARERRWLFLHEWTEVAWMAISLIISSVLIVFSLNVIYTKDSIMRQIDDEKASAEVIREYREFNAFDDKIVNCQDVVSLILEKHGTPYIKVLRGGTLIGVWSTNEAMASARGIAVQNTTEWSSVEILKILDVERQYRCILDTDENNVIIGVICQEI